MIAICIYQLMIIKAVLGFSSQFLIATGCCQQSQHIIHSYTCRGPWLSLAFPAVILKISPTKLLFFGSKHEDEISGNLLKFTLL